MRTRGSSGLVASVGYPVSHHFHTEELADRMGNWKDTLGYEFTAEPGSFLIQLRCDLHWDRDRFALLIAAMKECCIETQSESGLDRIYAEGFWYLSFFAKDWSTHPHFPRQYSDEYYEAAYLKLFLLADWYFVGVQPMEGEFDTSLPDS